MIWTYCLSTEDVRVRRYGHGGSKNYQETFIEINREKTSKFHGIIVYGPTIITGFYDNGTKPNMKDSQHAITDLKSIDDCKKCKWGLRMLLGLCNSKYSFSENP